MVEEKNLPNGKVAYKSEKQGHKYLALVRLLCEADSSVCKREKTAVFLHDYYHKLIPLLLKLQSIARGKQVSNYA